VLQLTPDFFYQGRTRTVAIYLWRRAFNYQDDYGPRPIRGLNDVVCMYKVHILAGDGNPVYTRESGRRIFSRDECYGWKDFAPWEQVSHLLTPEGEIKVRLELEVFHTHPPFDLGDCYRDINVTVGGRIVHRGISKHVLIKKSKFLCALLNSEEHFGSGELQLPYQVLLMYDMVYLKNLFEYLATGACPILRAKEATAVLRLPVMWKLAGVVGLEGLRVDVLDALTSENVLRARNVTPLIMLITQNDEIRTRIHFAKFFNRVKRFVFENMEDISNSESFKKKMMEGKEGFFQSRRVIEEFGSLVLKEEKFEPWGSYDIPL